MYGTWDEASEHKKALGPSLSPATWQARPPRPQTPLQGLSWCPEQVRESWPMMPKIMPKHMTKHFVPRFAQQLLCLFPPLLLLGPLCIGLAPLHLVALKAPDRSPDLFQMVSRMIFGLVAAPHHVEVPYEETLHACSAASSAARTAAASSSSWRLKTIAQNEPSSLRGVLRGMALQVALLGPGAASPPADAQLPGAPGIPGPGSASELLQLPEWKHEVNLFNLS